MKDLVTLPGLTDKIKAAIVVKILDDYSFRDLEGSETQCYNSGCTNIPVKVNVYYSTGSKQMAYCWICNDHDTVIARNEGYRKLTANG